MNSDLTTFLSAAKGIILKFKSGAEVADAELKVLLDLAFRHKDDPDELMQKTFRLATAIDEHHRAVFDVPRNQVDYLADMLNELVFLSAKKE